MYLTSPNTCSVLPTFAMPSKFIFGLQFSYTNCQIHSLEDKPFKFLARFILNV